MLFNVFKDYFSVFSEGQLAGSMRLIVITVVITITIVVIVIIIVIIRIERVHTLE